MRDSDVVSQARQTLGAQLAARRQGAGETQRSLARKLPYSCSTIASVETGRQHAPLAFWKSCDKLLGASGVLLDGYRRLEALISAQARERAETEAATARNLAEPGLGWQSTLNAAVASVVDLSQTLVDWPPRDLAPTTAAASNAATLRWLLAPLDRQPKRANGNRLVGHGDVAAVMAMHQSLSQLDATHGGGAVLHMALAYLHHDVVPLLYGRYSAGTGKALFAATSQLVMALAWMAYDAAHHDLARRAMIQALRLSHTAGDRSFGGRVLAAMSHQALHLGAVNEAIDLARAAAEGTRGRASPGAQTMFAATEARSQAVYGDQRELEEGCRLGNEALVAIGPIRSERTRDYLRELHDGLAPHHRVSVVSDFLGQARSLLPISR